MDNSLIQHGILANKKQTTETPQGSKNRQLYVEPK